MKYIAILALLIFTATATDVTLKWDANAETDLAGYRVYQAIGTNDFVRINTVPVSPSPTATVTNINSGLTNRFFVTAYNTANLESDPSNIVAVRLPFSPTNLTATVNFSLHIP